VWLIVAGVLAVAETANMTFVLIMFAGGALVAALAAGLGANDVVQIVVFIVASLVLLAIVRPFARRHMSRPGARTNADALIGMRAITLSDVGAYDGRVRLDNNAEWTARAVEGYAIPAGVVVQVVQINGATAVVRPADARTGGYS
jgi:membrane protein implicated in regulation of membrane protease activity